MSLEPPMTSALIMYFQNHNRLSMYFTMVEKSGWSGDVGDEDMPRDKSEAPSSTLW